MASPFFAAAAHLSNAVDAAMGEMIRIEPEAKKDSFGAPIDLDARQPVQVVGTFIDGDQEVSFSDGDRRISDFNSRQSSHEVLAFVDRRSFMGGPLPKQNDLLTLIERLPVRRFKIVDVVPDGITRLAVLLVRA